VRASDGVRVDPNYQLTRTCARASTVTLYRVSSAIRSVSPLDDARSMRRDVPWVFNAQQPSKKLGISHESQLRRRPNFLSSPHSKSRRFSRTTLRYGGNGSCWFPFPASQRRRLREYWGRCPTSPSSETLKPLVRSPAFRLGTTNPAPLNIGAGSSRRATPTYDARCTFLPSQRCVTTPQFVPSPSA
jgi:hypothetical protein